MEEHKAACKIKFNTIKAHEGHQNRCMLDPALARAMADRQDVHDTHGAEEVKKESQHVLNAGLLQNSLPETDVGNNQGPVGLCLFCMKAVPLSLSVDRSSLKATKGAMKLPVDRSSSIDAKREEMFKKGRIQRESILSSNSIGPCNLSNMASTSSTNTASGGHKDEHGSKKVFTRNANADLGHRTIKHEAVGTDNSTSATPGRCTAKQEIENVHACRSTAMFPPYHCVNNLIETANNNDTSVVSRCSTVKQEVKPDNTCRTSTDPNMVKHQVESSRNSNTCAAPKYKRVKHEVENLIETANTNGTSVAPRCSMIKEEVKSNNTCRTSTGPKCDMVKHQVESSRNSNTCAAPKYERVEHGVDSISIGSTAPGYNKRGIEAIRSTSSSEPTCRRIKQKDHVDGNRTLIEEHRIQADGSNSDIAGPQWRYKNKIQASTSTDEKETTAAESDDSHEGLDLTLSLGTSGC